MFGNIDENRNVCIFKSTFKSVLSKIPCLLRIRRCDGFLHNYPILRNRHAQVASYSVSNWTNRLKRNTGRTLRIAFKSKSVFQIRLHKKAYAKIRLLFEAESILISGLFSLRLSDYKRWCI